MSYSVDEKLAYNKKRKSPFATGYVLGVMMYRDYLKGDEKYRSSVRAVFESASALAKEGDDYGKGTMCGVRDAANERKAKKRK